MSVKLTEQKIRPICVICNFRKCSRNGVNTNGIIKYKKYCTTCKKAVYNQINNSGRTYSYMLNKKKYCEKCGFIPVSPCQLDVDHIDGNSRNNDLKNLQTLYANCHRLKTHNERLPNQ